MFWCRTPLLHRSSARPLRRHPDKNKDNAEEATEKFKLVLASKNRLLQARVLQDPPAKGPACSAPGCVMSSELGANRYIRQP